MDPYADAFVTSRSSVLQLIGDLSVLQSEQMSPLTPEWRVRDVVAHLCGVSEDVMAGNFPTGDVNVWANNQVQRRFNTPLAEIADTWANSGIETNMDHHFGQMVFDQISHEFDIRYALEVPGDTTSAAVTLAAKFAVKTLSGDRPVSVNYDGHTVHFEGTGEPIELRASSFDVLRALTGRRSWSQVSSLDWSGDLDYVRDTVFGRGVFQPATFDVVESSVL
jgi:hypothetical protein